MAYVMKDEHGFDLPRRLQIEFSKAIQHVTENTGTEISSGVMWDTFQSEYIPEQPRFRLRTHELHTTRRRRGRPRSRPNSTSTGSRDRPSARATARSRRSCRRSPSHFDEDFDVVDYSEHAIGRGANAQAVAYVETTAATATSSGASVRTRTSPPPRCAPSCRPSNASTAERPWHLARGTTARRWSRVPP